MIANSLCTATGSIHTTCRSVLQYIDVLYVKEKSFNNIDFVPVFQAYLNGACFELKRVIFLHAGQFQKVPFKQELEKKKLHLWGRNLHTPQQGVDKAVVQSGLRTSRKSDFICRRKN